MDQRFERAPIGVLDVRPDGEVSDSNEAARDLLDADADALAGRPVASVFPESVDETLPRTFEGSPEAVSVEEYYPGLDRWLSVDVVPTAGRVTVYLQDATEHRRASEALDRRQEDLARLTVINELISDVLAELVAASSRAEIAETICERLGETEIYEFAWVGERAVDGEAVTVRAAAGETGRTMAEVRSHLEAGPSLPEETAVETGEPVTVQPLGDDERVPEAIRRAAFADGLGSLLAIPLTYGSSVYGVVGIYASDREAFSARERASFHTLGEMAGYAINASRQRSLLLSDTVVELVLEVTDPTAPLVAAADEHDATLELEGLVPQGERPLCYLTVSDAAPGAVADSLVAAGGVEGCRIIEAFEDRGSLEVTFAADPATPASLLASRGLELRSGTVDDDGARLAIALPPGEDVRRIASGLTREFDGRVVAKRERERSIETAREFRTDLRERLTERQETALRTAFLADYFESPRGSSAEEVGSALDITGSTLLHHLRAGQRKLLAAFFEAPGDPSTTAERE